MLESWPGGARRGCGLALLCACLVLVAAGPAPAGEVPPSAPSRSLRLDPLFVDSPTLVFRFPQLVAGRDSAQLAFGWSAPRSQLFATTTGSEYGLGAMIRNDAAGGFVFSQGRYLSDVGDPFVRAEYTQSNVFQLGGGGRWGGLRWRRYAGKPTTPLCLQGFINGLGAYPPGTKLRLADGRAVISVSAVRGPATFDRPLCRAVGGSGGGPVELSTLAPVQGFLPGTGGVTE